MLELPESKVISGQLKETLTGRVITKVYADSSPHKFAFYSEDPKLYENFLNGKKIGESRSVGGQVEIDVEDFKILFSDGANIRFFEKNKKIPTKHQLYIIFEDETSLVCSIQMYGGIWITEDGKNNNEYYLIAKEKPSPLSKEFTEEYFKDLLSQVKDTISIKAFLATEQRIPGLGNGVLQDILFNAGINPKTKLNKISSDEMHNVYESIINTLKQMISQGGRDTEKNLFGNPGGYKTILSKNTVKFPCPRCGGEIKKESYLGGSVYYCPNCQPILQK